jgi:tetratricopeptide (TPR) repeat protein
MLTAKSLLGAATIHIEVSEFDQAEENVRAALALCETLPTPPVKELATALNCMAIVSFHRRELEQAEACYAKLLNELGSDNENTVVRGIVMNDLALVKIALAEPNEAVVLAQMAAQTMEASFGVTSAHYAQCLDTLAQGLLADGRPDEAEKVVGQSLEICAADIGEDSPQYGATLLTLSKIQHVSGNYTAAAHSAERSIGVQENTRGAAHPLTNQARNHLAGMRQVHSARAAGRPVSADEMQMFDEMYEGLGLTPEELSRLREHWNGLTGPERLEQYLNFHAEVAARRTDAPAARLVENTQADAPDKRAETELEDDEDLFHDLYGRHKLSPEVLQQRREYWETLTPEERRAAAALFRGSIRSKDTSK